jgi:hypothetical protein
MSGTETFDWFSKFRSGVSSVDDAERSGRPSASKTNEYVTLVKELVHEDTQSLS